MGAGQSKAILEAEQVRRGAAEIKYLCRPGTSDTLLIGFSGFSPPGRPPVYNYVRTLEGVDCHRLYVLDDHGPPERQCSYYLGRPPHYVRDGVEDLIRETIDALGVSRTIAFGTSKGGWAALYFGARLGLTDVIAGEPQVLLGRYLARTAPAVLEYIGEENLDDWLSSAFSACPHRPDVTLYVAENGSYRDFHIPPLLDAVQARIDCGPFSSHGDVADFFPSYLRSTLARSAGTRFDDG